VRTELILLTFSSLYDPGNAAYESIGNAIGRRETATRSARGFRLDIQQVNLLASVDKRRLPSQFII
jgi:hypothetical protein